MKRRIKMRKRLSTIMAIVAALAMLFIAGPVMADGNDTQIVNYEVQAINEIHINDDSVTLTVISATAGSAPNQATDASTYNITTNVTSPATKKITAAIDSKMGTGLTLQINVKAPSTGTGGGAKTLSTTAENVVTAIGAVNQSKIPISYTLDATVAAGVVTSANKIVTLTITGS